MARRIDHAVWPWRQARFADEAAMFSLLGGRARLCDGVSRREILRWGGLSALGLGLPDLLRADSSLAGAAHADACIFIFLFGGPSQIDTFDMKPEAPSDFRGEFKPIDTNVPGIQFCEHFPRLARCADKLAVIRSMHHGHPRHGYGLYYTFTGRPHARPDLDAAPDANDFPAMGPLISQLAGARQAFPPAVTLPRWNRFLDLPQEYAGETAGFLGRTYDPWLLKAEPGTSEFRVSGVEMPEGITLPRLAARRDLLASLDQQLARRADSPPRQFDALYHQAFSLLTSRSARQAFDLEAEPQPLRERYGSSPFAQGLLLARRLVEAGTRLVTVNWHEDGSDVKSPFWDTHRDNFVTLRERLIPPVDQGVSALLDDLDQRGMLARTLVVMIGEFGRTPKIGRVVMNNATNASGRDHWPHAYSALMAGGGVRGGQVHGASDERAAYVVDQPVTPPDLTATVLHLLGIDPQARVIDRQGRPHHASEGRPLVELL